MKISPNTFGSFGPTMKLSFSSLLSATRSATRKARRAIRKLAGGESHRYGSEKITPWKGGGSSFRFSPSPLQGELFCMDLSGGSRHRLISKRASSAASPFGVGCSMLNVGRSVICSLAFAFAASSHADSLLLRGATVHTVSGATLASTDVLVKDGKIAAIAASITEKADRTNDLTGLHLFPGMISPSTDLGLVEIPSVRASVDRREVGDFNPDVESWKAVNPDSDLIPVARANGITHFIPVPQGSILSGVSGVIATGGWTVEDMAVRKRAAYHLDWPTMSLATGGRRGGGAGAMDEQAKARREKIQVIENWFNDVDAYAKGRAAGATVVPAYEAALPLVRGELPLIIGADDLREIKSALAWAEKRKLKIVILGGRDAALVAEQLAKQKVPVIYNHVFPLPSRDSEGYDANFSAPGILHKAGVTVALTDSLGRFTSNNARNLPYAAAHAMAFGLPADAAIRAITLVPAQIYGVADKLGSIEVGKHASFFAATGDILDIRSQVKHVWLAGEEQSLKNRNTQLYDKFRNRPRADAK